MIIRLVEIYLRLTHFYPFSGLIAVMLKTSTEGKILAG